MPVKRRRVFLPLPRPFTPNWKVTITRDSTIDTISDTTDTSVTDNVLDFKCELIATESIGTFEMTIDNNAGTYDDLYSGGETLIIYSSLRNVTTKLFEGIMEKPEKKFTNDAGSQLVIKGTHVSSQLLDITVTKSYINQTASYILKDIIDNYTDFDGDGDKDYSYSNINEDNTETFTIDWTHKPFWDCVIDLCNLINYECFVDNDKDFHFFLRGNLTNTNHAIVMNDNYRSVDGLGVDTKLVKNRVIVYYQPKDALVPATSEDSTSQSTYNVKEKIITDTSIKTYDEAKERADAELVLLKDTEIRGSAVATAMLPVLDESTALNPGEQIPISIPILHIHNYYSIAKLTHKLDKSGDYTTEVEVRSQTVKIPHLFKKRIETEKGLEDIFNPNELRNSFNLTFEDFSKITTHTNLSIANDELYLSIGTTGTLITNTRTSDSNITKCEVRMTGQDMGDSTFYISVDGGISWEEVILNKLHSVLGEGKLLRMKVDFKSSSTNTKPLLSNLVVLYTDVVATGGTPHLPDPPPGV